MEDNYNIITNESLVIKPFSCFLGGIKLPMDDIFIKSNKFTSDIKEFKLLGKSYCLVFSKINSNECEMNIFLDNNLELKFRLYYEPVTLNLDNLNLSTKSIILYSSDQVKEMIYCFKSKYKFFDQQNKSLEEQDNFDTLKYINIDKKLDFDINSKTFLDLKSNLKQILKTISENKNEILEIDPLYLSFNFHKIFPEHLKAKTFKLILNIERKNFLEKLKDFIDSKDKLFLWIIGSDGVGKTVSLMYYTLISGGNSFYINLKLLKKNSDKMKSLFINEIIRFFYFKNKEIEQNEFMNLKNEIKYILDNEIFKLNDKENKIEEKYRFWIYLKNLISEISRIFQNIKITIIIDQYRDISVDNDYKYINSFLKYIYRKNHKIIFATSINNYEFQSNFFNNVDTFNLVFDNDEEESSIDYDLNEKTDESKDEYDIKSECEFYEKFLIKKEQKNMIKKTNETISVDSKFILNNEFKDYTLKIYYSYLVSGKILQNDFKDEEKKCFENFNYNLKYINKFKKYKFEFENNFIKDENYNEEQNILKLLNQEPQKIIEENNNQGQNNGNSNDNNNKDNNNNQGQNNENSNDNNNKDNNNNEIKNNKNNISEIEEKIKKNPTLKIINSFYNHCYNHITSKIENFYSVKENSNFIKDTNIYEYDKLKELRDTVYNQDFLNIKQLRDKMSSYPGKYLTIINKNFTDFNPIFYPKLERLQIKYSNRFFKMTLNEFLSTIENQMDISTNNKKGSGAGVDFEKKVINSIIYNKSQVFGQYNYKKRVVFSLVGKTNNSELTVKKHREEENNNYLYDFYNIKEYSDYIDDIDPIKPYIIKRDINLKEDLYLIVQVSKTGRSFDFGILKKVDNVWYLYLFQVTINKTKELKTKDKYISDSVLCESYLDDLYNIKIKKTFLIFVIPFDTYEEKFIKELEKRELYYIFYQLGSFYDKSNGVINNFNFSGAELIKKKLNELEKSQEQLKKSLEIWDKSIHNFLRRKRKNERLCKFYKRNLSTIGGKGVQLILEPEMKNKIIGTLYENKKIDNDEYELLFIQNCKFNNIKEVSEQNNLVIFFKIKDETYFFFEKYYHLKNGSFSQIAKKPKGMDFKNFKYNKKKINLNEISELSDLCFCFTLLGENIV